MFVVAALGSINETTSRADSTARVLSAIQKASQNTGVDFSYMLRKAEQESGLDATVKAKSSSATGLYQFVEQTWLRSIKTHGAAYGVGALAEKITLSKDGKASVADAATKKAILDLRNNPELSANLAAELAKDNKEALDRAVGGSIGGTELYLAHFLGSGGATQFLNALKTNPDAKAADILPTAASANKSVFYNKDGSEKSVREIYASFDRKFDAAGTGVAVASGKARDANGSVRMASATHAVPHQNSAAGSHSLGAAQKMETRTSLVAYRDGGVTPYYPLASTVASGSQKPNSVKSATVASAPSSLSDFSLTTNFATLLLAQMDALPSALIHLF